MTSSCALSYLNSTFPLGALPQSLSNASSPRTYCAANGREPNMATCCAPNPVNAYPEFGPCASWCDIPSGKFALPKEQGVLGASNGQELDQLFGACLMNETGTARSGSTLCEMPSAGVRIEARKWWILGILMLHYVDTFGDWM